MRKRTKSLIREWQKYIVDRIIVAVIFFLTSWVIGYFYGNRDLDGTKMQLKKDIANLEEGIDYYRSP